MSAPLTDSFLLYSRGKLVSDQDMGLFLAALEKMRKAEATPNDAADLHRVRSTLTGQPEYERVQLNVVTQSMRGKVARVAGSALNEAAGQRVAVSMEHDNKKYNIKVENLLVLDANNNALFQCANCRARQLTMKKCAKCKRLRYCSVKCQEEHWLKGHESECEVAS